jgi:hypothetical protein|tara:strand:+ start:4041 stop:4631 length:591 start_codon:yes stop_codon:yes gene_type:complete
MKIEEMTSKQISDELSTHGVTMHFNSKREKLEKALNAVKNGDVIEAAPVIAKDSASSGVLLDISDLEDFKFNGVELEGLREEEAQKLVRVIVRSNDPLKRESQGEIFTVGNRSINGGRPIKKYIPYNNEEGWHIPNMLLDHLKAAETQIFKKVTRNGQDFMEPTNIKAFNIEILPQLSKDELSTLQVKQKATGSIG